MIKDTKTLNAFEIALARQEPVNYRRNLEIFEALYHEARLLGVLPPKNPLDGIDVDVRLAKVMHARRTA